MIIRRIALQDYRGVTEREIAFGPGVTILEGPNEIGKSSLAEALRLIFEFPDSSSHRDVQAVVPVHRDAGPLIEIEVETGPYCMVYRKRFRKRPETQLSITQPRSQNLTGRAAHDRAQQILAETVDVDLWKALQIQQGSEITQAHLADSEALARALDQATGGSSGEDEGALYDRVRQEYEQYFTPTGRERAEVTEAHAQVQKLSGSVLELEEQYRAMEGDIEESARLAARQQDLTREISRCQTEAERLEKEWSQVADLQARVQQATGSRDNCQLRAEAAQKTVADRAGLVAQMQENRQQLAELRASVSPGSLSLEEARQAVARAEQAVGAGQEALRAAVELAQLRSEDFEFRRNELDCVMLAERHGRIEALVQRHRVAREIVGTNRVTDEVLRQIQEREYELRQARARLQEGGPVLDMRALEDLEIEVDGQNLQLAVGDLHSRSVTDEMVVALPGHLEMTLRPGASMDDLQQALSEATRARDELCSEHGVATLEAAAQANAALSQARRDLEDIKRQLAENLRDLTRDDLKSRLDELTVTVERYPTERVADPPMARDHDEARLLSEQAVETRDAATEAVKRMQAQYEQARIRLQELDGARLRLEGRVEVQAAQVKSLENRLEAAREERVDQVLATALEQARQQVRDAEAELGTLQARLESLQPEVVQSLYENAGKVLSGTREEDRAVGMDLAAVQARLETLQEAGLYEDRERQRSALAHAERTDGSLTRRAAAVQLLFETLSRHRNAARQAYVRPLTERIHTLGRIVFGPSFEVLLGEQLTIESRTLEGRTIDFASLSTGAQEQLGILTRLAVAMTVAQDGGVPLILDDTLGNTDPGRLQSMGAMLSRAGDGCQIIILTCTPDRFRYVGGAKLHRLTTR